MVAERRLRADAQRNRDSVVATAREVFAAGNFFDLRYDDFAGMAGVGTGTLYRHFPTREALAEAVFHEEIVTLREHARELQLTLPPADALGTFLRDMVAHMRNNEGLARTLAALLASSSPATRAASSQLLEQAVAELVAAAANAHAIRDDIRPGALMLALHTIGAAHERPDWRAETDDLITLLLDGLRPQ
jgi:AcrR family transcriptional regulator